MNYEGFKTQILALTDINLSSYKENQMRRRIDTLIKKHMCKGYDEYLRKLRQDLESLEEFVTYLTINVTEFFRNPAQ